MLLLGATALLALGPGSPGPLVVLALVAAGVVVVVGLVAARRPGSRAAFRAALVVAALDVALLVARGSALV